MKTDPPLHEALSGIFGSVSLAAWIFVFVPQLVENYRQGSAEGISLTFLIVWFVGDITNFFGALWAGLVPTVIALPVYFCFTDLILIAQCLYYNALNRRKLHGRLLNTTDAGSEDAEEPLLGRTTSNNLGLPGSRRRSSASGARRNSPCSNFRPDSLHGVIEEAESGARALATKVLGVLLVSVVGTGGWFVAWKIGAWTPATDRREHESTAEIVPGAQILGYISAACYLGARIPQIIKNYQDRSCEGLSLLFFILSLFGNATYGAGILSHSVAKDYVITNLPWLIGSLGTMIEDVIIFLQFHIYSGGEKPTPSVAVI